MRPLIPRVKVGDVLLGTRNLRYYLQTAATLIFLRNISLEAFRGTKTKSSLYRPSKDDEFLVTVNAWDTFGVYNVGNKITLLFRNPLTDNFPKKVLSPNPKKALREAQQSTAVRMDLIIFSKWFIRTPMKYTDLTSWPAEPYFMWATLHFNLTNVGNDNRPVFCWNHVPFISSGHKNLWRREDLVKLIKDWSVRGITRANAPQGRNFPRANGCGPVLEEIESMRREIQKMCSNPRMAQRLKLEDSEVYQGFVE